MSDYLERLVTRSFDKTEVVQPRLPSRFEPSLTSGADAPAFAANSEPEFQRGDLPVGGQRLPGTESAMPQTGIPGVSQAPPQPPTAVLPENVSTALHVAVRTVRSNDAGRQLHFPAADPSAPPTSEPVIESKPPSAAPREFRPLVEAAPRPLPPAVDDNRKNTALSHSPAMVSDEPVQASSMEHDHAPVVQTAVEPSRAVVSPAASKPTPNTERNRGFHVPAPSAGEASETAEKTSPSLRASAKLAPADRVEAPATRPSTPVRDTHVIARPRVRPLPAPATPAPVRSLGPEAAPTIHVTIGRIEVRATHPAPLRKQVPAVSPVMGLDQYLRRRAKGGGE